MRDSGEQFLSLPSMSPRRSMVRSMELSGILARRSPSSTSNSLILTCSELIHSAAAEGVSARKSALKSVRTKSV